MAVPLLAPLFGLAARAILPAAGRLIWRGATGLLSTAFRAAPVTTATVVGGTVDHVTGGHGRNWLGSTFFSALGSGARAAGDGFFNFLAKSFKDHPLITTTVLAGTALLGTSMMFSGGGFFNMIAGLALAALAIYGAHRAGLFQSFNSVTDNPIANALRPVLQPLGINLPAPAPA